MPVDEFADAVGTELGWPVPLYVYLEWEREGAAPPPEALEAGGHPVRVPPFVIVEREEAADQFQLVGSGRGPSVIVDRLGEERGLHPFRIPG